MPSDRCCALIHRAVAKWLVPLGAKRIENLLATGSSCADIAFIAGGKATKKSVERIAKILEEDSPHSTSVVSPQAVEKMRMLLDPFREAWAVGTPAKEIAAKLGIHVTKFNAMVSKYRRDVDKNSFPLRIGTKRQIRPRLHTPSSSDTELARLRAKVCDMIRSGILVVDIHEQTKVGVHRINTWAKGIVQTYADAIWMKQHSDEYALAVALWKKGANHFEIAGHYAVTPATMYLKIVQARRITVGEWFSPRTTMPTNMVKKYNK